MKLIVNTGLKAVQMAAAVVVLVVNQVLIVHLKLTKPVAHTELTLAPMVVTEHELAVRLVPVALLAQDKLLLALVPRFKRLLVQTVTEQQDILAALKLVPNKVKKIVTALVSLNLLVVTAEATKNVKTVLA